jgi:Ca2+-transporting ATPase
MYLLSSNLGEILLMSAAILAGLPLPLIAIQILYVNLATDGLPAIALSVDPPEPDIMRRPPRNPRQGIFTRHVVGLIGIGGVWSASVNLGIFLWEEPNRSAVHGLRHSHHYSVLQGIQLPLG